MVHTKSLGNFNSGQHLKCQASLCVNELAKKKAALEGVKAQTIQELAQCCVQLLPKTLGSWYDEKWWGAWKAWGAYTYLQIYMHDICQYICLEAVWSSSIYKYTSIYLWTLAREKSTSQGFVIIFPHVLVSPCYFHVPWSPNLQLWRFFVDHQVNEAPCSQFDPVGECFSTSHHHRW